MTEFPRQRKNRLLRELDKVNISVIKYATKYGQKNVLEERNGTLEPKPGEY